MGAESYFVKYKFENIIDTNVIDLLDFIKSKKMKVKIYKNNYNLAWYSINDILKMQFYLKNDSIQGFSLEGCFSCYDLGLELIYLIMNNINNNFAKLSLEEPFKLTTEELNNKDFFIIELQKHYRNKYNYFTNIFKGITFKSLPDKYFYKKIPFKKFIRNIRSIFLHKQT